MPTFGRIVLQGDADAPPTARGRDALRTLTRSINMANRVFVNEAPVSDGAGPSIPGIAKCLGVLVDGLKVWLDFPTADAVPSVPEFQLAERSATHRPSRSARWAAGKSHTLDDLQVTTVDQGHASAVSNNHPEPTRLV